MALICLGISNCPATYGEIVGEKKMNMNIYLKKMKKKKMKMK